MARVALVLGAGGAVGHAFHAGVLEALQEATGWDGRRADLIVGTSAGSIVGAMLRAGIGPADLYARNLGRAMSPEASALFAGVPWPRLGPADAQGPPSWAPLGDPARVLARAWLSGGRTSPGAVLAAALPAGRIPNDALAVAVRHLHRHRDGRWPQPGYWACAVRISDGARVVFGRDDHPDLGAAVAASCAIPAYYRPVDVGGDLHVDGGVHSPTNADVLASPRARPRVDPGFDLVVVSSPMSGGLGVTTRLGVEAQMRALFSAALRRELVGLGRLGAGALVFEPVADVVRAMGPDPLDTSRRAGVARAAHDAALAQLRRPSMAARRDLLHDVT
jgi:NTE family protein